MTLSNDLLLGLILGVTGALSIIALIQFWQGMGRVSRRLTSPGCLTAIVVVVVIIIASVFVWQAR